MGIIQPSALTISHTGISNKLICSVKVSQSVSLLSEDQTSSSIDFLALWDTGATNCAITELAAKRLGLIAIGGRDVSGLGGTLFKNTYMVDITLPNNIKILDNVVTELDNPIDDKGNKIELFGILIGMDIINMGDLSISNFEGKTTMSFRIPSIKNTDYVKEINNQPIRTHNKIGRNDPCPCGSGKKFKQCHGNQ